MSFAIEPVRHATKTTPCRMTLPSMKLSLLLLASITLLSSCVTASECAGDWYSIGLRDGRFGVFAQADIYARRCGVVDTEKYNAGYRDGYASRPNPVGL